jgi:hypothetical protein
MSSPAPQLTEQFAAARGKLERACELLLSPSPAALDQCTPLLEAAVTKITACRAALTGPVRTEPSAYAEGRRLQAAVRRARRLLESAAEYHQNWARRMGAMSAGYDSRGEPAAVDRGRRLIIRG